MGNLLSRLSENLYIHSSPVNFAYVASGIYNKKVYEGDMLIAVEKELNSSYEILLRQINQITSLCNQFYDDFQLGAHDSISISGSYIDFDLAGAKAFERRYLIPIENKNKQNINPGQMLFQAMNNKAYQKECLSVLKQKSALSNSSSALDVTKQQEFRDLISQIAKGYNSINLNGLSEITSQVVFDVLNTLTETKEEKRKGSLFSVKVTKSFKPKAISNIQNIDLNSNEIAKMIFTDDKGNLLNLGKQSGASTAVNKIKEYFLQTSLQDLVDILWTVLINMNPNLNKVINESYFKSFFFNELKSYGRVIFNIDNSNFVGMLLEQPLVFGINIDLDAFFKNSLVKIKARNVGQTMEKKTFADGSSGMYMSGSDVIFDVFDSNGNVKKSYRIQAKNTFQEHNFANIKIQDSIKLKTYADRIFSQDSPEKKSLFEYLLLNRAFLSQYGLVPGYWEKYDDIIHIMSDKGTMLYSQALHKDLEAYILFFLNQTLAYLVGGKVYAEAEREWNLNKQNLFFIYQGKYLVPISLFLYSALRLIIVIREGLTEKQMNRNRGIHIDNTIGELTYNARLEGINVGMSFARQLRSDKYYYLNHRTDIIFEEDHGAGTIFDSAYRYPENLVEIGHRAGEQLLENASFPQINFRMHLQEIDKFLR